MTQPAHLLLEEQGKRCSSHHPEAFHRAAMGLNLTHRQLQASVCTFPHLHPNPQPTDMVGGDSICQVEMADGVTAAFPPCCACEVWLQEMLSLPEKALYKASVLSPSTHHAVDATKTSQAVQASIITHHSSFYPQQTSGNAPCKATALTRCRNTPQCCYKLCVSVSLFSYIEANVS